MDVVTKNSNKNRNHCCCTLTLHTRVCVQCYHLVTVMRMANSSAAFPLGSVSSCMYLCPFLGTQKCTVPPQTYTLPKGHSTYQKCTFHLSAFSKEFLHFSKEFLHFRSKNLPEKVAESAFRSRRLSKNLPEKVAEVVFADS